jgi:hypothetical protein
MVAIFVLALLHTPPGTASLNVVLVVLQSVVVPSIAVGCIFTVTVVIAVQLPIV